MLVQNVSDYERLFASYVMPRTHGANKSILFAQIFNPYGVTQDKFAQIKDILFAHVYKA